MCELWFYYAFSCIIHSSPYHWSLEFPPIPGVSTDPCLVFFFLHYLPLWFIFPSLSFLFSPPFLLENSIPYLPTILLLKSTLFTLPLSLPCNCHVAIFFHCYQGSGLEPQTPRPQNILLILPCVFLGVSPNTFKRKDV